MENKSKSIQCPQQQQQANATVSGRMLRSLQPAAILFSPSGREKHTESGGDVAGVGRRPLSVINANGKANGKAANGGIKNKKKFAQLPSEEFGIVSPSGEVGSGANSSKKKHGTAYSRRHNAFSPGDAHQKANKGRKSGEGKPTTFDRLLQCSGYTGIHGEGVMFPLLV
jgi:hypothetical protein